MTYRGYYFDSDLQLYYLSTRYYDYVTGRFISPDDLSYLGANGDLLSYNLYAYCSNNPIMFTDPSGHLALTTVIVTGVIVGAVIGGVIGGVVAYNAGQASNLEENDLMISTAIGVCEGAIIGSVAGGLISSTGGVIAAYGKASIIATAMITSTSTITAKVTELCALQIKQSLNEGLNGWQIANNCIGSMFENGYKLLLPALTKVGTTGFSYLITDISKYKIISLSLADYLTSSGGKLFSYTFVAYAWCYTVCSILCNDPAGMAIQRGYNLK